MTFSPPPFSLTTTMAVVRTRRKAPASNSDGSPTGCIQAFWSGTRSPSLSNPNPTLPRSYQIPLAVMLVPGVPSSASVDQDGIYWASSCWYFSGTLLAVLGKILLAMAEISLRIVTRRVRSAFSAVPASMALAQMSYSSQRSSSGLTLGPHTASPLASRFG